MLAEDLGQVRRVKPLHLTAQARLASPYLPETVSKVVLQNSNPATIRQLILHISNNKVQVDGSVGQLTLAKRLTCAERLDKHFL